MKNYRNKEWMINKYVNQKLSMKEIAEISKIHPHTVWENLIRLKITRRKTGPINQSKEAKKKIGRASEGRQPMLGKSHSDKTKDEMSKNRIGDKNGNWKGGVTLNSRKFRKSREYRYWRLEVLKRDNYKCQYENCGLKTNIAHHIKPAKDFLELRVDINNGMTICLPHHKSIHKTLKNGKYEDTMDYAYDKSLVGMH